MATIAPVVRRLAVVVVTALTALAAPRRPRQPYGWPLRQNHPWRDGRYRIQPAHDWNSASVRDGVHVLEVEVVDTRGNSTRSSIRFSVSNRHDRAAGDERRVSRP